MTRQFEVLHLSPKNGFVEDTSLGLLTNGMNEVLPFSFCVHYDRNSIFFV